MKDLLITHANKVLSAAGEIIRTGDNSYRTRKVASEIYISLKNLHDKFQIDPISLSAIEFVLNKIVDKICYEEYFNYYMGFYYLPSKVFNKEADLLAQGIYESNVNISCFRCKMHASEMLSFSLDSSVDDYFFSRGEKIYKAIANYMNYPFEFDISSFIYVLLNYYQTLKEYEAYSDTTYQEIATRLILGAESLFLRIIENECFVKVLGSNLQLKSFWNSTVPNKYKRESPSLSVSSSINNGHRWILNSMYSYNPPEADAIFQSYIKVFLNNNYNNIDANYLIVRLICNSLFFNHDIDLTTYELNHVNLGIDQGVKVGSSYFFRNFDRLRSEPCSAAEISLLFGYNDATLREKVAACMQNVDPMMRRNCLTKQKQIQACMFLETWLIGAGQL